MSAHAAKRDSDIMIHPLNLMGYSFLLNMIIAWMIMYIRSTNPIMIKSKTRFIFCFLSNSSKVIDALLGSAPITFTL